MTNSVGRDNNKRYVKTPSEEKRGALNAKSVIFLPSNFRMSQNSRNFEFQNVALCTNSGRRGSVVAA